MVINTNIHALDSHRNMRTIGEKRFKTAARLSSGLRVNTAADDAACLAISEKMRAQIRGLSRASYNALDGISLFQVADGAFQEVQNIVQRIRELTVQAANDTNTYDWAIGDRMLIQKEIDELLDQIDLMGETVVFNTRKIMDGSMLDQQTKSETLDYLTQQFVYYLGSDGSNITSQCFISELTALLQSGGQDSIGAEGYLGSLLAQMNYIYNTTAIDRPTAACSQVYYAYVTTRTYWVNSQNSYNVASNEYTLTTDSRTYSVDSFSTRYTWTYGTGISEWFGGAGVSCSCQTGTLSSYTMDCTFDSTTFYSTYSGAATTRGGTHSYTFTIDTGEYPGLPSTSQIARAGATSSTTRTTVYSSNDSYNVASQPGYTAGAVQYMATRTSYWTVTRNNIANFVCGPNFFLAAMYYTSTTTMPQITVNSAVFTSSTFTDTTTPNTSADTNNTFTDYTATSYYTTETTTVIPSATVSSRLTAGVCVTDPTISSTCTTTTASHPDGPTICISTSTATSVTQLHMVQHSNLYSAEAVDHYIHLIDSYIKALEEIKPYEKNNPAWLFPNYISIDDQIRALRANQNAAQTIFMELVYLSGLSKSYQYTDEMDTNEIWLQTGANANQGLNTGFAALSTKVLGLGDGDKVPRYSVNREHWIEISAQLKVTDYALNYISSQRAKLGALQNRLEHTIKSLDITTVNLSASESRLRDADMGKELMELTKANILQQAAASMLAQANIKPEMVLQLLRG